MESPWRADVLSDADLVREAQGGEVRGLGLLLDRHAPAMRAVALSILGHTPDAQDAVQEATIIALRRIGDVREPAAAGPWLRAVTRNVCRMHLRTRLPVPIENVEPLLPPSSELDPAALLDRHALRDWTWRAIDDLSPDLRLVTMLRYFTGSASYEQIAQVCGVPVGTVRSRLSQARVKLHRALTENSETAFGDVAALTRVRRGEAEEMLQAAHRGGLAEALADAWNPELQTIWPTGRRTAGFDYLVGAMDRDLDAGVRQRLVNVVASRDVLIWEAELISPPDDPFHCPPEVLWVQFLENDRVTRLRLFHPRRAASTDA
jgi:RNA polymerase sigma factor (sigma-70 family)